MNVQLPLEVIRLIILYIPFTRLQLLCEDDDSLKPLIAPILYRYVRIGDRADATFEQPINPKFHNITLLEFYQLASGRINAKIQHLKIKGACMEPMYSRKFWQIIADSSEYFRKIPIIDFEGDFDMYMEYLPTQSLRQLSFNLSAFEELPNGFFPPNITALTIDVLEFINFPRLPASLKYLKLECLDVMPLVFEFPPFLELFSIQEGTFSDELPESLLKLAIDDIYDITLPGGLIELAVKKADAQVTFPPGLKKLKLESIDSLVGMNFPCNLEVLDLEAVRLTTLDGILFPSLLRELRLERNGLTSLDNVVFPNLILLNISSNLIESLSQVKFPKLEYLIADENFVKDWSVTSLPDTLKELEMTVVEEPKTLKFPPHLKVLKIYFNDDLAEYSDLQVPDTLEELYLDGGVSNIFGWNLPHLQSMTIDDFSGPIKVPESVVDLSLLYENYKLRDEIQIPSNVEKLEIPYPLDGYPDTVTDLMINRSDLRTFPLPPNVERLEIPHPLEAYPATVTDLRIRHSDMRSFPLPPNVEKVCIDNGELEGSLFTTPDSLICFRGHFNGVLNTPSNWDTDNQIYKKNRFNGRCTLIKG